MGLRIPLPNAPTRRPAAALSLPASLRSFGRDHCLLSERWGISEGLSIKLLRLDELAGDLGLLIISGIRTCSHQERLQREAGSLATSCARSTHVSHDGCPATGADLWTTPTPVRAVKHRLAAEAFRVGLRVGGGPPVDPSTGTFKDWNHVDLGPVL